MAKFVLIVNKDSKLEEKFENKVAFIAKRIIPDNIQPVSPVISLNNGVNVAILNPPKKTKPIKNAIYLGHLIEEENWDKIGSPSPEGSYALVRWNENAIELVSDLLASRTIWYVKTDTKFIASSSQRAIIMILGDLILNHDSFLWMLSCGCLGPNNSWDSRITMVNPDEIVHFDKKSWSFTVSTKEVLFQTKKVSPKIHFNETSNSIKSVFANINFDPTRWILLLSGGYDSRGILVHLNKPESFSCLTWGDPELRDNEFSDVKIAEKLANRFHAKHTFYPLDNKRAENFEDIYNRFIICSEGRVENIAGYLDGFSVWKWLFEQDYIGVIRGDACFGNKKLIINQKGVFRTVGIFRFGDDIDPHGIKLLEDINQALPPHMDRRKGESLYTWRDRLYQQFRMPVVMSALNEIKTSYVEVCNPLIFRSIVLTMRTVPDKLRSEKHLWKNIIDSYHVDIPFAKYNSIVYYGNALRQAEFKEILIKDINQCDLFTAEFKNNIIKHISVSSNKPKKVGLIKKIRNNVAKKFPIVEALYTNLTKYVPVDYNILALRVSIISRTKRLLIEDIQNYKKMVSG